MVTLGLSGDYMHVAHVEECPDLGPSCARPSPPPPEMHQIDLWDFTLRLDAELGILPWLSVDATLWLRALVQQVNYTDLSGATIIAPDAGLHHRNETLLGPADPWLLLHAGGARGLWSGSARLGVSLPLGSTVDDPFALGAAGIAHEHFQFGTGTVDPIVGLDGRRWFQRFAVGAWALAKLPLYENGHGYRAGARVVGGLYGESRLGTRDFTFDLGLDVAREQPEQWHGVVYSEGNVGRTDLLLDAVALWRFAEHWAASAVVRVYLFTDAAGEQV